MTSPENNEPKSVGDKGLNPLGLELSQEELDGLFKQCAETLVRKGEISDNFGEHGKEEGIVPQSFRVALPPELTKKVFHAYSDSRIATSDSFISFAAPRRMDGPDDEVISDVLLHVETKLVGSGFIYSESYMLECNEDTGVYTASFEGEFGTSHGGTALDKNVLLSDDEVDDVSDEFDEGRRPFTHADAEKLRKVIDYIENPATLDNL